MRESGGHVPTRPKRSRLCQCWRCCTVGTSRSRAPCGRSRGRLGLSGKLFFCRFLPNIFLGADESALTCSTRPKRSRLSQCWRFDTCWHVAGHEPIWGAMTNLAFAAKLPADFRRLDGCRGLRSRTKRGLSDLGFFSAGGDAAGASKRSRGSSSAGVSNAGASRQSRLTPVLAVLTPLARRVYEPIWCGR